VFFEFCSSHGCKPPFESLVSTTGAYAPLSCTRSVPVYFATVPDAVAERNGEHKTVLTLFTVTIGTPIRAKQNAIPYWV
jgi:hypothetical protein